MHVIRTLDLPQATREYLRFINRRPLVPVDDVASPIKPVRRVKAAGHPANLRVVIRIKKVSN